MVSFKSFITAFLVAASVSALPSAMDERSVISRASFSLANGKAAQALNKKFAGLKEGSPCKTGENACVKDKFAQCPGKKFVTTACAAGTQCFALPLVNKPGTSITCDTLADALARIAATGATGGLTG